MNWEDIREEKKVPITVNLDSSIEKELRKISRETDGVSCSIIVNHALKKLFANVGEGVA